jgi:hypothetical protein
MFFSSVWRGDRVTDGVAILESNLLALGAVALDRSIAPLLSKRTEVLVALGQRFAFLASGILEVHAEPNWPDHEANDAGGDILANLPAFLVREVGHALIVGFDLSHDLIAVRELIGRLDDGSKLRRATRAARQ